MTDQRTVMPPCKGTPMFQKHLLKQETTPWSARDGVLTRFGETYGEIPQPKDEQGLQPEFPQPIDLAMERRARYGYDNEVEAPRGGTRRRNKSPPKDPKVTRQTAKPSPTRNFDFGVIERESYSVTPEGMVLVEFNLGSLAKDKMQQAFICIFDEKAYEYIDSGKYITARPIGCQEALVSQNHMQLTAPKACGVYRIMCCVTDIDHSNAQLQARDLVLQKSSSRSRRHSKSKESHAAANQDCLPPLLLAGKALRFSVATEQCAAAVLVCHIDTFSPLKLKDPHRAQDFLYTAD